MKICVYGAGSKKNIATISLHVDQEETDETCSRAVPLYQTTAYVFDYANQAANGFALKEGGQIYTRLTSQITEVLEKKWLQSRVEVQHMQHHPVYKLFHVIINLTQIGDNIVSTDNLYGGTFELFENTLKDLGREVKFVDSQSLDKFEEAIDDKTKVIYEKLSM